jgi:hypothetical protein
MLFADRISLAALWRVTSGEPIRACVGVRLIASQQAPELRKCGSGSATLSPPRKKLDRGSPRGVTETIPAGQTAQKEAEKARTRFLAQVGDWRNPRTRPQASRFALLRPTTGDDPETYVELDDCNRIVRYSGGPVMAQGDAALAELIDKP